MGCISWERKHACVLMAFSLASVRGRELYYRHLFFQLIKSVVPLTKIFFFLSLLLLLVVVVVVVVVVVIKIIFSSCSTSSNIIILFSP